MGNRPRSTGRRTRPSRALAKRILVVTEGTKTELQYVERLQSFLRNRGATAVVKKVGVGEDPLNVVRKCMEIRDQARGEERFEMCVCLVDVDQHSTLSAALTLAEKQSISLLVSNLKFEVWLRWHAENKRSSLSTSQLDALVNKLGLVEKKALPPRFPIDKVHSACAIARQADPKMAAGRIGPNPSSAMPILVDLLNR